VAALTLLWTASVTLLAAPGVTDAGAVNWKTGGALTQSFWRLENSCCTLYVLTPAVTDTSWPLHISPISPGSGEVGTGLGSYQASGGARFAAAAT